MIGIIDYRMGNLRSVQKAFEHVGEAAQILTKPKETSQVDRLVLPGVGAFADGMRHLDEMGWSTAIRDFIHSGNPFLGICIGMQVLFESSQEDARSPDKPIAGLSIFDGQVVRFKGDLFGAGKLKVPHMGWNSISWSHDDPILAELEQNCAVYFVHCFYPRPAEQPLVSAVADYGGPFCASIWRDNIWATQFHPEKSQRVGLRILSNFASV